MEQASGKISKTRIRTFSKKYDCPIEVAKQILKEADKQFGETREWNSIEFRAGAVWRLLKVIQPLGAELKRTAESLNEMLKPLFGAAHQYCSAHILLVVVRIPQPVILTQS